MEYSPNCRFFGLKLISPSVFSVMALDEEIAEGSGAGAVASMPSVLYEEKREIAFQERASNDGSEDRRSDRTDSHNTRDLRT